MKIDDENKNNSPLKDFREVDEFLKTVTKKFTKEPITLEILEKAYSDVVGKGKPGDNSDTKNERGKKTKRGEEKSIFHDIFIKPKENKIKEIRKKQSENKEIQSLLKKGNGKEKKHDSNYDTKARTNIFFVSNKLENMDKTGSSLKKVISLNSNSGNNKTIERNNQNLSDELAIDCLLSEKFLPKEEDNGNKKNFFNQLIQIKPPEGINAVVASPLMDCIIYLK